MRRLLIFPVSGRRAVEALIDDPIAGRTADPAAVEQVVSAYLGCMEPDTLRRAVVLSVLQMNEMECVVDAWQGLLTADLVASSLAYGSVLDDLPADVVEDMASAAADCGPDRQWWIDDVILSDELQLELSDRDAECVAARYLDVMGVKEVIRRRLLNAPLLALPPEDEARLDMSGQCTVTERGTLKLLIADVGACVADVRAGTDVAAVTACDQTHDAEVFAVHDITADHPTWPGVRAIMDTAQSRCTDDPDAIAGDPGNHRFVWIYPLRRTWEQGDRTVLCLLVHKSDGVWTHAVRASARRDRPADNDHIADDRAAWHDAAPRCPGDIQPQRDQPRRHVHLPPSSPTRTGRRLGAPLLRGRLRRATSGRDVSPLHARRRRRIRLSG